MVALSDLYCRVKHSHGRPDTSPAVLFLWTLVYLFFRIFHYVKDIFLNWIFNTMIPERFEKLPTIRDEHNFVSKSAVELAHSIRTKEITSVQLVQACIERIELMNPILNAIVDGPFQEALEIAKVIDEKILNNIYSEKYFMEHPFLGIPFTTKDSTAVSGKLHTLGLLSRKNTRSTEDAECIRILKEAGAIILATTNVPEINRWQETRNLLIGQTSNPYDTRRTAGGSSGGEAAVVASASIPFGMGTDIGGSIRMPSFYCGIFGHKPTIGIINTRGCTMRTGQEKTTMVVVGPMTRYAHDLLPLMKVLVGPSKAAELNFHKPVNVKKLKYYYIRENSEWRTSNVSTELQDSMNKVIAHFQKITGTRPKEIQLSYSNYTSKMWRYWMTQEGVDFSRQLGNGQQLNGLVELGNILMGRAKYTLASVYSLLDAQVLPQESEQRMKHYTKVAYDELAALLGDDGVLLFHSYTSTAPFHYLPLVNPYGFSYCTLFNVLHVPATQVPLGLSRDNLPLGIQVVAAKNCDRLCMAVAEEIDGSIGGWVPPANL